MAELTHYEALEAINKVRSAFIATQNLSWSNTIYPIVAILEAAGFELEAPTEAEIAEHITCYGGAGGFPGRVHTDEDVGGG